MPPCSRVSRATPSELAADERSRSVRRASPGLRPWPRGSPRSTDTSSSAAARYSSRASAARWCAGTSCRFPPFSWSLSQPRLPCRVEVGDQLSGPVRHGGFRPFDAEHAVFDAAADDRTGSRRGVQPAQTLVQREPAFGEPVVRTGRDRQARVGISDGGSRQQRLSDIAVAARTRPAITATSEPVTSFELNDLVVENGSASELQGERRELRRDGHSRHLRAP